MNPVRYTLMDLSRQRLLVDWPDPGVNPVACRLSATSVCVLVVDRASHEPAGHAGR